MATAALNTGVLQGRPADGGTRAVAGVADWRAMTDAEIMLRVREGDDTGFSFLIEKYRKPIINFMYRMVHNQAVAEELAQECFLRVYRSRQTYRAEAKFTTWLYRIATNLGVNHARDTKYERTAQTVYLDQPDRGDGDDAGCGRCAAGRRGRAGEGRADAGDPQARDGAAGAAADRGADA